MLDGLSEMIVCMERVVLYALAFSLSRDFAHVLNNYILSVFRYLLHHKSYFFGEIKRLLSSAAS